MKLGVERGKVTLCEHDEKWEHSAIEVITLLKSILCNYAIDIQHIGSTSVKAIPAKPIIDIAVGVDCVNRVYDYEQILFSKGIVIAGSPVENQIMCELQNKTNTETHHIHFVKYGSKEWNNYINFRDYLNTHPVDAQRYADKKKDLFAKYNNDRVSYTKGKAELISDLLEKATAWANNRNLKT